MEIASDGRGKEAVVSSGGVVVARLPYIVCKRFGLLRVVGMPTLSHVLGPVFTPAALAGKGSQTVKLYGLIGELLRQLPRASHTAFRLHPGLTDTLAFAAAGFHCAAEFTVLVKPAAEDILWRNMRDKTRNGIRRAAERLTVSEMDDMDVFLDFYEENLRRKGEHNRYQRRLVRSLIVQCLERDAGRLLVAADANSVHSAMFTVWDADTEYYFMSTRRADAHNGAVSLLLWEALQAAALAGRTFDMDGLHVVGDKTPNLLLLTGFGGAVVPLFHVQRSGLLLQLGRVMGQSWDRRRECQPEAEVD